MEDTDGVMTWRKASRSGNGGENCVEVGSCASEGGSARGIRDSKSVERGHLVVTAATFGALLASVRRGDLDLNLASPHTDERPLLTG